MKILYLGFVLLNSVAWSAKVLWVSEDQEWFSINHEAEKLWSIGEVVCLYKGEEEVTCGEITQVMEKGAKVNILHQKLLGTEKTVNRTPGGQFVDIEFQRQKIKKGEPVELKRPPKPSVVEAAVDEKNKGERIEGKREEEAEIPEWDPKNLASLPNKSNGEELNTETPENENRDLASTEVLFTREVPRGPMSTLTAGLEYLSPQIHFQLAPTNHFSSGLKASYLVYPVEEGQFRGLGPFLTFTYYPRHAFEGFWVELGVGLYDLKARNLGTEESIDSVAFQPSFGFSWLWDSGLTFRVGTGLTFFSERLAAGIKLPSYIPSVLVDVGIAF